MSGEHITGKEFEDCSFKNCDFSGVHFDQCRFIECQFTQCNLSLLNLASSRLADVNFEHCKMLGIDWTRVHWPQMLFHSPVHFDTCILKDCSFFALTLDELQMHNCKAINVDFRQASFKDSDFSASDFAESQFHDTNLSNCNFSDAINYDIDIHHNTVKGAQFSRLEATRLLAYLHITLLD